MATVLIVDDATEIREVLRLWAEASGLEVVGEATNGREAVEVAARVRPDAIVLDEQMPETTGLQALPELRDGLPESTIVVYSSGSQETERLALALGATAYFSKASSPKRVMQTVVDLLAHDERVAAG